MKATFKIGLLALAATLTFSTNLLTAHGETSAIDKVIAGDHRAKSSKRDMYRHPKETLAFFQVKADQTIVEILPGGGGWYTEILAPLTKEKGNFYAAQYDPKSESSYRQRTLKRFAEKLAANPEAYGNVKPAIFNAPANIQLGEDGTVDRVLTFRNLHNWIGKDEEVVGIFKAFYAVLKPGGKLGLVDHRLPEDRTEITEGYVKESYAIKMAEAAGFKLEARSDINANPKDTIDHPKGVWTLPPSFAMGDENKAKYQAIGESNRMTLLFVKK